MGDGRHSLAKLKARVFPGRIFYGWYIATAGAGTNFIVLGITFFGFGVFLEEFRLTSGWSVTAIALGYSIQMLQQGLLAPVTGHILDRVGPRKMAVAGVTIVSLSMLLFSQATIGLCFFAFVTPERWWLFIPFYLTFGIGHAGWLVMAQSLPADFFGSKHFATIRGLIIALQIPVTIVVPLFMGFVFDTRGNYQLAYLMIACITVGGALTLTRARIGVK